MRLQHGEFYRQPAVPSDIKTTGSGLPACFLTSSRQRILKFVYTGILHNPALSGLAPIGNNMGPCTVLPAVTL